MKQINYSIMPLGSFLGRWKLRNGTVVLIDGYRAGKLTSSDLPGYTWDLKGGNGCESGIWNTAWDLMHKE